MLARYDTTFSDKATVADVAIVGLGPGGLAAALAAAKSGKQVVAFSDRAQYIRGQRLVLTPSTINFLKTHTEGSDAEDTIFWEKYNAEGTAQTKDIEKFLYRKLIKYDNAKIIQLTKPDTINSIQNDRAESSSVIKLSNGQQFYTKNILSSDGARHNFANLMNTNLNAGIQYSPSPIQERHRYHGVVQLKLKYTDCFLLNSSRNPRSIDKAQLASLLDDKDGCILHNNTLFYFNHTENTLSEIKPPKSEALVKVLESLKQDEGRVAHFKEHNIINAATNRFVPHTIPGNDRTSSARKALANMKQGWDQLFEPKSYVFPNADKTKFYFAGEIPKLIFDESDEATRGALLQKWASNAIERKYGYSLDQLEYKISSKTSAKDKLQATVFEMDMQICQQPLVPLAGGMFAQVGDARRTPNYNLGHGLNDAIAGGVAFVDALGSSSASTFQETKFLPLMETMDTKVEEAMKRSVNPEQKKLIESIDKFIDHFEPKTNVQDKILLSSLKNARDDISKGLTKLNEAITAIQPLVDAHQHRDTGLGYRVWRWVASIFSESAGKTKSANLLADISNEVQKAVVNGRSP